MHVRFQTIEIYNLQIMAFDGLLSLRGENFRWADLVSGNLKEVKATSPATVVLWSTIVNLFGIEGIDGDRRPFAKSETFFLIMAIRLDSRCMRSSLVIVLRK